MCLSCGFYKGRQVIDLAKRKEEREARMQAKREAIRGQQEAAAPTEAEEVSEQKPAETKDDSKS